MITFFVLFFILSSAIANYKTFHTPLGFDWQDRWQISIDTGARWQPEQDNEQLKQLVNTLRQQTEIKSTHVFHLPVFQNSTWSSSSRKGDTIMKFNSNTTDDKGLLNSGVELIQGRWFGPEDAGQHYRPVMINELFVKEYFQHENPIGFQFKEGKPEIKPRKIVGVFKDYRQKGDFAESVPYIFNRYDYDAGSSNGMRQLHVSFTQQPNVAYEERLQAVLKTIAPTWRFKITPMETLRKQAINDVVIPMTILSVVVLFLLLMVAMGLFGVLWQDINRRTQEIGVRRALGASKWSIQKQIIGELVVLALFSIALASIVLVQLPLLQLLDYISWSIFAKSMLASTGVMLLLVVLCALYPSRTAIKIQPAIALHYE